MISLSVSIDVPSLEEGIRHYGEAFGLRKSRRRDSFVDSSSSPSSASISTLKAQRRSGLRIWSLNLRHCRDCAGTTSGRSRLVKISPVLWKA